MSGRERSLVTPEELRALLDKPATKYHSRRTYCAELDRWFDSGREARAAVTLTRRQRAGEIRDLVFQPRYPIHVAGQLVTTYVGDFAFAERGPDGRWRTVIADAKGFRTPTYRIKKRLLQVCLGITVEEV
jgi:hypothetical protein